MTSFVLHCSAAGAYVDYGCQMTVCFWSEEPEAPLFQLLAVVAVRGELSAVVRGHQEVAAGTHAAKAQRLTQNWVILLGFKSGKRQQSCL